MISAICQPHQRVKELNGIIQILEGTQVFTKADENRITSKARMVTILILIIVSATFYTKYVCISTFHLHIKYSSLLNIFSVVVETISVAVIICEGLFFLNSLWIYIATFKRINQQIKQSLQLHLQQNIQQKNFIKLYTRGGTTALGVKIRKIIRLYMALLVNIKEMNDYYNPTKLVHATMAMFALILNNYVLIMGQIDQMEPFVIYSALSSVVGCALVLLSAWKHADILMTNVSL